MGVHNDFLLIGIFKRLSSRKPHIVGATGDDVHRFTQSEEIASEDVHVHGLSDVVGVMSRQDFVSSYFHSTSIESLSSENATESAVISQPNDFDDFIHSPPIKFFVRHDGEWEAISYLIELDCL